jgi:hypothetical protein
MRRDLRAISAKENAKYGERFFGYPVISSPKGDIYEKPEFDLNDLRKP